MPLRIKRVYAIFFSFQSPLQRGTFWERSRSIWIRFLPWKIISVDKISVEQSGGGTVGIFLDREDSATPVSVHRREFWRVDAPLLPWRLRSLCFRLSHFSPPSPLAYSGSLPLVSVLSLSRIAIFQLTLTTASPWDVR